MYQALGFTGRERRIMPMPPGLNMRDLTTVPKNILKLDIKKDHEKENGSKSKFGDLVS